MWINTTTGKRYEGLVVFGSVIIYPDFVAKKCQIGINLGTRLYLDHIAQLQYKIYLIDCFETGAVAESIERWKAVWDYNDLLTELRKRVQEVQREDVPEVN